MNAHDEPSALDATVNDVSLAADKVRPRSSLPRLVKPVAVLVARANKLHSRFRE